MAHTCAHGSAARDAVSLETAIYLRKITHLLVTETPKDPTAGFASFYMIHLETAVSFKGPWFHHLRRRRFGSGRITSDMRSYQHPPCPIDPKRRRISAIWFPNLSFRWRRTPYTCAARMAKMIVVTSALFTLRV